MNEQAGAGLEGVNSDRLFLGSCLALISTSVAFGAITSMMGDFTSVFALSNTQAGWIGGAAIWGFTISIFVFGPLVDVLGMGKLLRLSMVCHLLGPVLMILANGFWMLFAGALVIALGNGTVEAVCNPLVATIYPTRKTQKLNQFHVWFPGGIVIGGLMAFFIDKCGPAFWDSTPVAAWQAKIVLVLIPTVIYGIVFTAQKFPATERVQSGHSFSDMVKATFLRPLFIVLFCCMALTASLELGVGRWMGPVMNNAMAAIAGTGAGILVLAYGNGLMAILRFFAGPIIQKLSPPGVLVLSAVLAGIGLLGLSYAEGAVPILIVATVFYVGVCYFWPTMLGVTAERVPKGGALALAMIGGWGMAAVGLVTTPTMGKIADTYGHDKIEIVEARTVIQDGIPALKRARADADPDDIEQIDGAISFVESVDSTISSTGELPPVSTATALRSIQKWAPEDPVGQKSADILGPADSYGGLVSFRWVSSLSIILIVVFGALYVRDHLGGGYKVEHIGTPDDA